MENCRQLNALLQLTMLWQLWKMYKNRKNRNRKPIMWMRPIFKRRKEQGAFHNLVVEMRLHDTEKYMNYLRMSPEVFDELLRKVGPKICKEHVVREPISEAERLCLTLRYLASGDSMVSLSYAFRIGKATVTEIIRTTCTVIWDVLQAEVLPIPHRYQWEEIAKGFENTWQLPNCIGAIDGKHVVIEAPPNSGSDFYNYKNSHSIVLMAVCDFQYKFTLVDIGARGRQSDGGIFRHSEIGKRLLSNELDVPPPRIIEYGGDEIPHYFVGDEAFPLSPNLMRPFPGRFLPQDKRIFNYRLSRARRVIENSFGILVARWRIYRRPINASLQTTENIVKATICLHNFLMTSKDQSSYCPNSFVDCEDNAGNTIEGTWRGNDSSNLIRCGQLSSNNSSRVALEIRNQLAAYFFFDGAVSFQWDK